MTGLHVYQKSRITPGRCGAVVSRPSPGHSILCGKPEIAPSHAGESGTFDRYDNFYAAMDVVRQAFPMTYQAFVDNPAGCALATRILKRLREAAQAEIPYGATTPNRTWDGRWA